VSLLTTLSDILRDRTGSVNQYVQRMDEQVVINPFLHPDATAYVRIAESMPDATLVNHLSKCQIVGFTDWAAMHDGTSLWDGLYTDIIKPLKKRDFHFVFHLGDVTNKMVYDIDEVLDIIGDYSTYGKVTLMLDNDEAGNLWSKLNGPDPDTVGTAYGSPRASEKYQFLFNTMRVDSLVVVHGYNVEQLSREGRFALSGMPPISSNPARAKTLFSSGYGMGLLLQLGPWHCMALGLAFSGAGREGSGASVEVSGVESAGTGGASADTGGEASGTGIGLSGTGVGLSGAGVGLCGAGVGLSGAGGGLSGAGGELSGAGGEPSDDLDTSKLMTYLHDWISIL